MTDLAKKLKTAGAFDDPWLKEQLRNWNASEEQKKADFMEHIYQVYRPGNSCYTGLWEKFCLTEAGPFARQEYFNRLAAVEEFKKQMEKENKEPALV
jgi:hypothetical protein